MKPIFLIERMTKSSLRLIHVTFFFSIPFSKNGVLLVRCMTGREMCTVHINYAMMVVGWPKLISSRIDVLRDSVRVWIARGVCRFVKLVICRESCVALKEGRRTRDDKYHLWSRAKLNEPFITTSPPYDVSSDSESEPALIQIISLGGIELCAAVVWILGALSDIIQKYCSIR